MKPDLTFDKFDKIPSSMLDNINEISDEEIFKTADNHTGEHENEPEETETETKTTTGEEITDTDEGNKVGDLVTGEFATDLMDALLPAVLVTTIHFIGFQIDKKTLLLTAREKKAVAKATQRALDSINVDFKNPWVNLSFVISVIYGSKIIEQIPNIKRVDKKQIEIKKKDIADIAELAKPTDEQLFNDEFDKLADEVVKQGRRKTRSAAKKMLLKENIDAVNILREKFGLSAMTEDLEETFSL